MLQWLRDTFGISDESLVRKRFSDIGPERAKLLFYALLLWAVFLTVRLCQLMIPRAFGISYTHVLSQPYYDQSDTEFFSVLAAVSATLWVISVGILSLFRETVAPTHRSASRLVNVANRIDARTKNSWILMGVGIITGALQTALYFSLISLLPWVQRWTMLIACIIALALNAWALNFVFDYETRTQGDRGPIVAQAEMRVERIGLYITALREKLALSESEATTVHLTDKLTKVERILHLAAEDLQTNRRQMRRIERHEAYLLSAMSTSFLKRVTVLFGVLIAAFASFPTAVMAVFLAFAMLLLGIYVSVRYIVTLVAFQTDV